MYHYVWCSKSIWTHIKAPLLTNPPHYVASYRKRPMMKAGDPLLSSWCPRKMWTASSTWDGSRTRWLNRCGSGVMIVMCTVLFRTFSSSNASDFTREDTWQVSHEHKDIHNAIPSPLPLQWSLHWMHFNVLTNLVLFWSVGRGSGRGVGGGEGAGRGGGGRGVGWGREKLMLLVLWPWEWKGLKW